MDQKILQDGMSEPYLDMLLDMLPTGRFGGRRMAILMMEALRSNYAFYDRYAGYLDVMQAIAVFTCRGSLTQPPGRTDMEALSCLTEAGWRKQKIELVQEGVLALQGSEQSFDNLAGEVRSLRGGLMVLRDVAVVPSFLPQTWGHTEYLMLRELMSDLKCPDDTEEDLRRQAWTVVQDWYKTVLQHLEHGDWKSLGWSCVYESQLDGLDEKETVRRMIREDLTGNPEANWKEMTGQTHNEPPGIGSILEQEKAAKECGVKEYGTDEEVVQGRAKRSKHIMLL